MIPARIIDLSQAGVHVGWATVIDVRGKAPGAKGVGIDAVSFGGYNDPAKAGPSHRALLKSGRFIVEELIFPDEIMDRKRRLFVCAPVKLRDCRGAWTRAALWEYA